MHANWSVPRLGRRLLGGAGAGVPSGRVVSPAAVRVCCGLRSLGAFSLGAILPCGGGRRGRSGFLGVSGPGSGGSRGRLLACPACLVVWAPSEVGRVDDLAAALDLAGLGE